MRTPKAVGLGAKLNDDESRALLYDGASLSQLALLFDLDNREIARKLHGVSPCGERQGYPIYRVKDAAPFLVPPETRDIEKAIKRMSPKDLPPALTKEYWSAQQARLKFEEDNGDLWRTGDVIEAMSETFKTLRMSILLLRDQVERQTDLTDRQRDIIQTSIDELLNRLADSLLKRFQNEQRSQPDEQWTDPDEDEDEPL